jgi:phosphatidylglycerol:prolipoprotein diacylglycerol transferase
MSFNIFGIQIYLYGVIIASAILAAFLVGLFISKKMNYKEEIAYLILLICVPCGIVAARVYYVVFSDWSLYNSFFDIINLRAGGIAIYGGVIGGAIGLFAVSRIKKCGFFTLADIVVICLILAQSIGRWGNFTNREAHGFAVGFDFFPLTVNIDGQAYLATFFYESILNFIGFFVLLFVFLKKQKKWGVTSACYLIWYGVVRACIEPLRTDSLLVFGSNPVIFNRVSFLLSIALVVLGMVLLVAVKKSLTSQENSECLNTKPMDTKKAK